jgi:hypothetical protein
MNEELKISQIRQEMGVSNYKNIAFANFAIGEDSGELIAISGISTRIGTVGIPVKPLFITWETPPGHSRSYDSEYKILEEIAQRYIKRSEMKGKINLFTERQPCISCFYVVRQFQEKFPNIILKVNYLKSN